MQAGNAASDSTGEQWQGNLGSEGAQGEVDDVQLPLREGALTFTLLAPHHELELLACERARARA